MPAKFKNGSAARKRPSANEQRNSSADEIHVGEMHKENTMSQTVVERTAEHIGESVRQASRAGSAIADAIEDGVGAAKRVAKQGGDAAEEFLDDTTLRLQRHLVLTVATTFALGVAAGALIGWMKRR
jgi:hypothetical protein